MEINISYEILKGAFNKFDKSLKQTPFLKDPFSITSDDLIRDLKLIFENPEKHNNFIDEGKLTNGLSLKESYNRGAKEALHSLPDTLFTMQKYLDHFFRFLDTVFKPESLSDDAPTIAFQAFENLKGVLTKERDLEKLKIVKNLLAPLSGMAVLNVKHLVQQALDMFDVCKAFTEDLVKRFSEEGSRTIR